MEMDFHCVVMQGPFWSHTSYCILKRGEGLGSSVCLLYIKALISLRTLHSHNSITSPSPITMGIWISSSEYSGKPKGWDHCRYKCEQAPISSSGCLHTHSTASSFSASPCYHFIHSITLGFTRPGQSSVNSISYLAYSVFPSPLLRPRRPTRKHQCVHFCKVPSLSLSGSSFLGPFWNRVDGNEMGTFWHHWLTWCPCSLLLLQMDWSEIPPDWQVFLIGGSLWFSRTFTSWGSPMS